MPRIRMKRLTENLPNPAFLNKPARVHNPDAMGDIGMDAHVMGNYDQGVLCLLLDPP